MQNKRMEDLFEGTKVDHKQTSNVKFMVVTRYYLVKDPIPTDIEIQVMSESEWIESGAGQLVTQKQIIGTTGKERGALYGAKEVQHVAYVLLKISATQFQSVFSSLYPGNQTVLVQNLLKMIPSIGGHIMFYSEKGSMKRVNITRLDPGENSIFEAIFMVAP